MRLPVSPALDACWYGACCDWAASCCAPLRTFQPSQRRSASTHHAVGEPSIDNQPRAPGTADHHNCGGLMVPSPIEVRDLPAWEQAVQSNPKVVAHFWAGWCEPCAFLDGVLAELGAEHPGVAVVRVEAEEAGDVSEKLGVSAVPYFAFFRGGQQVDSLEGADAAALTAKVAALAGAGGGAAKPAAAAAAAPPQQQQQPGGGGVAPEARLKALISQQPVMLFMKGSPDAPKCGFSRRVVEALRAAGASDFGSFDILTDEGVRSGLKAFSDWPTYPQLYIGGEFLGGCDIIEEMAADGELAKAVAAATAAAGGPGAQAAALRQRVVALVRSHPVMLFMKGTPDAPQCGFSRRVVEALRAAGESDFGSFDILTDEGVRAELKALSNWPTYPQLFVRGELLGGCDIIEEMAAEGELRPAIEEMRARLP